MNDFVTAAGWWVIVIAASVVAGALSEWFFGGIGKIVKRFRSK